MLWLVLHCARLPLEVSAVAALDEPAAVVETAAGREVLCDCNAAAMRSGLHPGMTLGAARACLPALRTAPREPAAERAALERLAGACYRFTDHVALEPPADVVLEIGGSRRLFGGLERLLACVHDMSAALERAVVRGIAPVPAAARLLAHHGGGRVERCDRLAERLGALPVRALDVDTATLERLAGWGVTTLGECLALPREGLARRLGKPFLDHLDRLRGAREETPPRFHPPGHFEAVVSIPEETRSLEWPIRAVERLLVELEAWLRGRDAGIQRLRIDLYHRHAPVETATVGLATPAREAAHIAGLARERLERTTPAAPVTAIGLRVRAPVAYHPPLTDLWTDAGREPPERLLERLRARLGREAVHGLALAADHRPERAWSRATPGASPAHEPVAAPPRPLWLLAEPGVLPLDARRRPRCRGELELLDGPERIETGWWDGDDVERDYYVARDPGGSLLWIYRERRVPARWFLHGLFA